MELKRQSIREGDIFEVLSVDGGTFEIRYGYYEDFEQDGLRADPYLSRLGEDGHLRAQAGNAL